MKQQLRTTILEQLKRLDLSKKKELEKEIQKRLFKQPFWKQAKIVGITYSTSFEWDTIAIIQQAWIEDKIVVLPKSNHKSKELSFIQINQLTDLEAGYANLLEPIITKQSKVMNHLIDLLIVPGLMFDAQGYRLGFGGGFYDRYLSEHDQQMTTVSLASEFQMVEKLPIDYYDIPVDYIITNEACLSVI